MRQRREAPDNTEGKGKVVIQVEHQRGDAQDNTEEKRKGEYSGHQTVEAHVRRVHH